MKTKEKYCLNTHVGRFNTDQQCHDFLIQTIWGGKPKCPKCRNNQMNYYLSTRKVYKCSDCSTQFTVTKGTIFERSKIPLKTWFLAIYIFTTMKRGVSSCQLAKMIGVQQRTAWFMLQRLRLAMKNENNIVLNGIVEADETFCTPKTNRDKRLQAAKFKHEKEQEILHGVSLKKRLQKGLKFKRGRKKGSTKEVLEQKRIERGGKPYDSHNPSEKIPFERGAVILGMIERGGRVVMKKIGSDRRAVNRDNIYPLLTNHISKDAVFITDELNLYHGTSILFAQHLTVNHEVGYVVDGVHSNTIENAWKHFKKMIEGSYFHISLHHFDGYLNENTYRWNRRTYSELAIFDSFMPLVAGKKITYRELTSKGPGKMAA